METIAPPVVAVIVKVSLDAAASESETCRPVIVVVPLPFWVTVRPLVEITGA